MKPSRSEYLERQSLRLHIRRWGNPEAPPLVLLHGWMDVSASFQFVVDAFKADWNIIAPDWRGFGPSGWQGCSYWFPDYLADLEMILDHYFPEQAVPLVGHSLGGVVACLYAGLRPRRVSHLVTLEGFGIAPTTPDMAPDRYRDWLDHQQTTPRMHVYADRAAFVRKLLNNDRRLTPERAAFLAEHLACPAPTGEGLVWNGDPWHKARGAYLYRLDESMAVWRAVEAPTLWVTARDSWIVRDYATRPGDLEARRACFRNVTEAWIEDSDHMLQHDQPEQVAQLLEGFCK